MTLLQEDRGAVRILTLNRPAAMNAMDADLTTRLGDAVEAAAVDDRVRVIIITGAGDRAFCAGMDLKAFAAGEVVAHRTHPEWGFGGVATHPIDKPIISAVNGFALGGGTELAVSTDLIVADERAMLGFPEVLRGLFAAGGGVLRAAQQAPPRVATELILTGRPMPAEEALRWGLINEVAPVGASLDRALALAERVAAAAPLAVRASKRLMRETALMNSWTDDPWRRNHEELERIFASEDAAEGVRAFAEKRAPQWKGR